MLFVWHWYYFLLKCWRNSLVKAFGAGVALWEGFKLQVQFRFLSLEIVRFSISSLSELWEFMSFEAFVHLKWVVGLISLKFVVSRQIRSDQSLSHVRLFVTPWIAARQASLSITNSQSSPRLTSIESVMPSSHLIRCRPLLLLPPNPSQHQSLYQWVNSSREVAKVLEFQL